MGEGSSMPTSTGHDLKLVVYHSLGNGATGTVFDADLFNGGRVTEVAAKFYDPDSASLEAATGESSEGEEIHEDSSNGDVGELLEVGSTEGLQPLPNYEKEYMFKEECNIYRHLANSTSALIAPHLYGVFQGEGFSGYQTGLILMEKLSGTFEEFDNDMTEPEKQAAYNHALKLHRLGIHHGDLVPWNFGRRAESETLVEARPRQEQVNGRSSVVIYDFSHSSIFEVCNLEECFELRQARRDILEGGKDRV